MKRGALAALLFASLVAGSARADQTWPTNQRAHNWQLDGLHAPQTSLDPSTAALRLGDVAVGACVLYSVGTNATFRCATDGTDFLSPSTGVVLGGHPATSFFGRAANSSGPLADIACSADGAVAWRSGTTLGCSALDYSKLTGTPSSLGPSGSAGGDLASTYPNPTVVAGEFSGSRYTFGAVSAGQYLTLSGTTIQGVAAPASLPPSGAAGGGLGGTYPNPTVTLAIGAVGFGDGSNHLSGDATNFNWNSGTNYLALGNPGTALGSTNLDVAGQIASRALNVATVGQANALAYADSLGRLNASKYFFLNTFSGSSATMRLGGPAGSFSTASSLWIGSGTGVGDTGAASSISLHGYNGFSSPFGKLSYYGTAWTGGPEPAGTTILSGGSVGTRFSAQNLSLGFDYPALPAYDELVGLKASNYDLMLGYQSAPSPSDTGGWVWTRSLAGVPTGVPSASPTSLAASVIDTSDDRWYVYRSGWKAYGQYTGGHGVGPLKTDNAGIHSIAVAGTDYVVTVHADGIATGTVQLASVDASNMLEGAVAWVNTVGDFFRLKQSALTTTATTVITANNKSGFQWIRVGAQNISWQQQTTWSVDPQATVHACSDEFNGDSDTDPLCTLAELAIRVNNATYPNGGGAVVRLLSNMGTNDTAYFNVRGVGSPGAVVAPTTTLVKSFFQVVGVPTTVYSGTISSPAQANAGDVADNHFTDGSAPAFTRASGRLWKDTTHPAYFWPQKDLGGGSFRISQPELNATQVTLVSGDAWQILQLPSAHDIYFAQTRDQNMYAVAQVYYTAGLGVPLIPGYQRWVAAQFPVAATPIVSGDFTNCSDFGGHFQVNQLPGPIAVRGGLSTQISEPTPEGTGADYGPNSGLYTSYQGDGTNHGRGALFVDRGAILYDLRMQCYDSGDPCLEVGNSALSSIWARANVTIIGGSGNTSKIFSVAGTGSSIAYNSAPPSGMTSDGSPIQLGGTSYAISALPIADASSGSYVTTQHPSPSITTAGMVKANASGVLSPASHPSDYIAAADLAAIATSGSATDLITGTIPCARLASFTGDVTNSACAVTIANDAVTNAKLANMATATIKGRVTAGTGDPQDLTGTQATTLLDAFTSSLKGVAPASGGGTANFLRADGTWATPPGTGGGGTITALTGDVSASGSGSVTATLNNIPTTATQAGKVTATAIAAPSTPGAGTGAIYVDSTSKNLAVKDDAGVVKHGVQTFAAGTHNFLTGVADNGLPSAAQPVEGDVVNLVTDLAAKQPTITWPTAAQVNVSAGTSSVPVGDSNFTHDTATHLTVIHHLQLTNVDGSSVALNLNRGGDQLIQKAGSGDLYLGTAGNQHAIIFTNGANRLTYDGAGVLTLNSYATAGHLQTNGSGVVSVDTASYQPLVTWPATSDVLVSAGTGTAPTGDAAFQYDTTNHRLTLASSDSGGVAFRLTQSGDQYIEKQGTGRLFIGTLGSQTLNFYTNDITRATFDASGNLQLNHYTTAGHLQVDTSGHVTTDATSYQDRADYPSAPDVLVSAGFGNDPLGDSTFTESTVTHLVTVHHLLISNLAGAGSKNYLKLDGSGNVLSGISDTDLEAASVVNVSSGLAAQVNAPTGTSDNYLNISNTGGFDTIGNGQTKDIDRRRTFIFYESWSPGASSSYYLAPGTTTPPAAVTEFYFDSFQPTVAHLTAFITTNTLTGGGSPGITCSATKNGGGTILVALPAITGTGLYTTGDVAISIGSASNTWGLACTGSNGLTSGTVTGTFTMELR